ncbi:acyltransferase [Dactylosporangium salmoneum]|uniref:Acyltransferase n=1 Tax=Dactylosporangium salmoneum TaxID=53361 RepID=A0ABP5URC0_9ACTN
MTTERDRAIDALRAVAILGVVLGHWLVTAVVLDSDTVRVASPLRAIPWLAPASWLFQTLALFFFVGGMVAARSSIDRYGPWLRARLDRLFRPVLILVAVWSGALIVATVCAPGLLPVVGSHTVLKLVASPLWFLLVFAALTAATPLVRRLHPAWPFAVVAAVDLARLGLGAPAWLGWLNLAAGWLVPFCLGAAWTRGRFRSRRAGWLLLVAGAAGAVTLTGWFGYPVSMVGVPGEGMSNLNPPSLAAVAFGIAQCGAALLLMPALRRAMRHRRPWLAVALINLSAMTIFLWHQTSLLVVTLLVPGPLDGLHTAPAGVSWLFARLLWLPVFAAVLAVSWLLFHRFEHRGLSPAALLAGTDARGLPAAALLADADHRLSLSATSNTGDGIVAGQAACADRDACGLPVAALFADDGHRGPSPAALPADADARDLSPAALLAKADTNGDARESVRSA